ncbi:MAG: glycosyltransferase family 9 protein [Leeuwenhoekiella sp.]
MGKKTNKPGKNSILVIRLSAMGDVAMTIPVLLALSERYPDVEITVLSKAFLAPLFKQLSQVKFFAAEVKGKHSGVGGLYRLFLELKKNNFNAIADLHGVIRSHVLSGFFRTIGTKVAKIDKGRKEKKALIRSKNKSLKPLKTTHQRYTEVFKRLGYALDAESNSFLKKEEINTELHQKLPFIDRKLIGLAPFAAHDGKKYPLALVGQVIEVLANNDNYAVVLFGGGTLEVEQLKCLEKKYPNTYSIAGKYSFAEELSIISNLEVMISMDSGNGHLAAAYGIPVVTVWGVTHPYLGFTPYNQPEENQITADRKEFPLIPTSVYGNKMPNGYENVMATIPPKKITDRVNKILNLAG